MPLNFIFDRFEIPLNFIVELILLRKGWSLIHSGAVQYGGRNYLFPAFGGTGKTTTVSTIVFNGGKLFGDDMNIVKEREILSYPLDFTIYPYHLDILKIKDEKIKYQFRKTEILDDITNRLRNYNSKVSKLLISICNSFKTPYINLSPRKIFGENCIVKKGQIDEVYFLGKDDTKSFKISVESIDPAHLAEVCTNILFHEWYQSMRLLYAYSVLSTFSLNSIYHIINNLFRRIFTHYECRQIKIHNNLDNLTYQKQLISYLKRKI